MKAPLEQKTQSIPSLDAFPRYLEKGVTYNIKITGGGQVIPDAIHNATIVDALIAALGSSRMELAQNSQTPNQMRALIALRSR